MNEALAQAARISSPVLLLHGLADKLTAPVGSERLAAAVSSPDLTFRTFEGAYHELHHEPERDEVLELIATWIREHAASAGASA
jgi:alpha-beta hydrolase superfamily lysophospholipase